MTQTTFKDLHIFTAPDPRPSISKPVIVVLAESYKPNQSQISRAQTSISYIGPLDEFQQAYATSMAQLFSRDKARIGNQKLSESDFFRYLNRQIEIAQPLSSFALNSRGIKAYSWPEEDAHLLKSESRSIPQEENGIVSFHQPIDTSEDVYQMIAESITLKEIARESGAHNTTWTGRPDAESSMPKGLPGTPDTESSNEAPFPFF